MNTTEWSRGLVVTGGGAGVVSHAGLALLRHMADKTAMTGGLSAALATPRILVHDRGPGSRGPGLRDRGRRPGGLVTDSQLVVEGGDGAVAFEPVDDPLFSSCERYGPPAS
jgi:hypothetical protein